MKVGFYGHVRQYHGLKTELDAAIREVLESGEYVMGPTLGRFEKELAAYPGMRNAGGAIGRVHTVYGHATGWMMHMMTHLIEYVRWFNGYAEAEWVAGQADGREVEYWWRKCRIGAQGTEGVAIGTTSTCSSRCSTRWRTRIVCGVARRGMHGHR